MIFFFKLLFRLKRHFGKYSKFQRIFIFIYIYVLNQLFANWGKNIALSKSEIFYRPNGIYALTFTIFGFFIRFWVFELLYIFYLYGGAPLFWLITLYLCFSPYFISELVFWILGWFFLWIVIMILLQVPVDPLLRPHNPYLKDYYNALQLGVFKKHWGYSLFWQLIYTAIVVFLFLFFQLVLFLYFYFLVSLVLEAHGIIDLKYLVFLIFWVLVFYCGICKVFYFFFRQFFFFLQFVISIILIFLKWFSSTSFAHLVIDEFQYWLSSTRSISLVKLKSSNQSLDWFEEYIWNRYFAAESLFFLRYSKNYPYLDILKIIEFVKFLEEEDIYEDELNDPTTDYIIAVFEFESDEENNYDWDVEQDAVDDLDFYLDLEAFTTHDLDPPHIHQSNLFKVDEFGEIRYDKKGRVMTNLLAEDFYDPEAMLADKPYYDSIGELRLEMIESLLLFNKRVRLVPNLESNLDERYLAASDDPYGDEGEMAGDITTVPFYEYQNLVFMLNFDLIVFFRSFLKHISFESQQIFCYYYEQGLYSRAYYTVFLSSKHLRTYLIRSLIFYDLQKSIWYKSFFLKRLVNYLNQDSSLVLYFESLPVYKSFPSANVRWQNTVLDSVVLPNFRLVLTRSDWIAYIEALKDGACVDYYDLLQRLFFNYNESLKRNSIYEGYKLNDFENAFVLDRTIYQSRKFRASLKAKFFRPDAFFFDSLSSKHFYMFDSPNYDFLKLKNVYVDVYTLFLSTAFSKSNFYDFSALYSPYRLAIQQNKLFLQKDNFYLNLFESFRFIGLQNDSDKIKNVKKKYESRQKRLFYSLFRFFIKQNKIFFSIGLWQSLGSSLSTQLAEDAIIRAQLAPLHYSIVNSTFSDKFTNLTSLTHFTYLRRLSPPVIRLLIHLSSSKTFKRHYICTIAAKAVRMIPREMYRLELKMGDTSDYVQAKVFEFYCERDYLSTFLDPNDSIDLLDLLYDFEYLKPNNIFFLRFLRLKQASRLYDPSLYKRFQSSKVQDPRDRAFIFFGDDAHEDLFYEYHWTHSVDWQMPDLNWEPPARWRPPANWRPPKGWKGPSIYWIPPKYWYPPIWWRYEWGLPKAWVQPNRYSLKFQSRSFRFKMKKLKLKQHKWFGV